MKNEKRKSRKLITLFLIGMCVIMAFASEASKVPLAYMLGIVGFIISKTLFVRKFIPLYIFVIFGISLIMILNYEKIIEYAISIFQENDGGNARQNLYSNGINLVTHSPFFGLGHGSHGMLQETVGLISTHDMHNTILTIVAQCGIIGILFFVNFYRKIILRIFSNPSYFALIMSLMSYLLFSDFLRKPAVWIILALIFYNSNIRKYEHNK